MRAFPVVALAVSLPVLVPALVAVSCALRATAPPATAAPAVREGGTAAGTRSPAVLESGSGGSGAPGGDGAQASRPVANILFTATTLGNATPCG